MRKIILQIVFIFIMGITIYVIPVHADGERTSFGSESYNWELGVDSPIGIYAHATQGISTTEIYVQYDITMLEYNSGGELIEPGRIRITGNAGQASEYQQLLQFTPLVAGETQIVIQDSTIIDVNGGTYTTQTISAPVNIALPDGWQLEGIQVNGIAIENFMPTTITYSAEVEASVEQVDITVLPIGQQVDISRNTLEVGNNSIYIVVTNANGEKVRYTLHINRAEEIVPIPVEENIGTEELMQEPQVMVQGNHNDSIARRNQTLLYVLLIVLLVALNTLIFIKLRISKRNKRISTKEEDIRIIEWYDEDDDIGNDNIDEDVDANLRHPVIEVNHVVMDFKREKDEATSIKEHVIRTIKRQHSYEMFRALDDISFHVNAGEVVGVIGTNGSGKSTILKIISGVLLPTSGTVKVDTSKIQLLTLGTGFDMELTGRENVYLNGALIGYTKEYIDQHYDEIVNFAELEGFMEEKVRNYSSGMVSRLGFAIATARNTPEILILDEVLSVGDMFFRKKSTKRIKEMIHGGSTVLIVSHSTATIKENCTRAIWIEKSKLKAIGTSKDVCDAYEKMEETNK